MKNKSTWILILVTVLLIGGAYFLYNTLGDSQAPNQLVTKPTDAPTVPDGSQPPAEEVVLPEFTVFDRDGNPVKLSQFRGKPVILNFWSSNCGPCRMEMPDFQKAYETYGEQVHFLMVNMTDGSWDTRDSATKFIEKEGFTFPVYFDEKQEAASLFAIRSLPTTFYIDKEGAPVAFSQGMIRPDTLQQGIDMILK